MQQCGHGAICIQPLPEQGQQATTGPHALLLGILTLMSRASSPNFVMPMDTSYQFFAGELEDSMESFFLSETTKYLYLLHANATDLPSFSVFTTEGHLLPPFKTQAMPDYQPRAAADIPAIESVKVPIFDGILAGIGYLQGMVQTILPDLAGSYHAPQGQPAQHRLGKGGTAHCVMTSEKLTAIKCQVQGSTCICR